MAASYDPPTQSPGPSSPKGESSKPNFSSCISFSGKSDDSYGPSQDGSDHNDPREDLGSVSPEALQGSPYPGSPMQVYPFPPGLIASQPPRSKRRQVKNACTNCQKACKKCDDARPCLRCVKYGVGEECVDSQRKERKKGIKRGPYKKRDGKGRVGHAEPTHATTEHRSHPAEVPNGAPPIHGAPPGVYGPPMAISYMGPLGYAPGFYSQVPVAVPKSGDPAAQYTPFYLAPVHHAPFHLNHNDGEHVGYGHAPFAGTFITSYPQPYPPQYIISHPRPDEQTLNHGPHSAQGKFTTGSPGLVNDEPGRKDGSASETEGNT